MAHEMEDDSGFWNWCVCVCSVGGLGLNFKRFINLGFRRSNFSCNGDTCGRHDCLLTE